VAVTPLALPPRAYRAEARSIAEQVALLGAQIVHSHGYRTDVVTALSRLNGRTGRVSTAHGYTGGGWKNRTYEGIQAIAWRRFDRVVAVSEPLVDALKARRVEPDRIRLIPNAWRRGATPLAKADARERLGIDPESRVIGWAGRISPEKGLDVALDAFSALEPAAEALELHVIGEGRLQRKLESRTRELGIEPQVVWHGAVENAAAVFRAFDLFVLSSRTEGTPMVLFEAISAGAPIVATQVGGVPDVISEAEAWLVPPEAPEALATALREALRLPEERCARARRARARLDRDHAFEPWIEAHMVLYSELINSSGSDLRRSRRREGVVS
jgi:glycosyltransferase involved in cell wall biosynthesis